MFESILAGFLWPGDKLATERQKSTIKNCIHNSPNIKVGRNFYFTPNCAQRQNTCSATRSLINGRTSRQPDGAKVCHSFSTFFFLSLFVICNQHRVICVQFIRRDASASLDTKQHNMVQEDSQKDNYGVSLSN